MGRRFNPTVMDDVTWSRSHSGYTYLISDETLAKIANTHVGAKYSRAKDSAAAIKKWMAEHGLAYLKSAKLGDLTELRNRYIKAAKEELLDRPKRVARQDIEKRVKNLSEEELREASKKLDAVPGVAGPIFDRYYKASCRLQRVKREIKRILREQADLLVKTAEEHERDDPGYGRNLLGNEWMDFPRDLSGISESLRTVHATYKEALGVFNDTKTWFYRTIETTDEVWTALDHHLPGGLPYSFHQYDLVVKLAPETNEPMWEAYVNDNLVAHAPIQGAAEAVLLTDRVIEEHVQKLTEKAYAEAAHMGLIDGTLADLSAALSDDLGIHDEEVNPDESAAPTSIAPLEDMDF